MAGSVHLNWYATTFRGDKFAAALEEIAPLALRYNALDYAVYRSRDDRYKFVHMTTFEAKLDWERFWYGPEFIRWRERHATWYQVPMVYVWHDLIASGASELVVQGSV